jgi:hypothetical protein
MPSPNGETIVSPERDAEPPPDQAQMALVVDCGGRRCRRMRTDHDLDVPSSHLDVPSSDVNVHHGSAANAPNRDSTAWGLCPGIRPAGAERVAARDDLVELHC